MNNLFKDHGPQATVLDLESSTLANTNFRAAIWTGCHLQVTLMSIPIDSEAGLEIHPNIDQFLRVEAGRAKVLMGTSRDDLTFESDTEENCAILVPAGMWHNIINTGGEPLKLYSIYAPPNHRHGTVHATIQDAGSN